MPLPEETINAEKARKPRPDLVPARAIMAAGRSMAYGAAKHGDCTWRIAGTEQADVRTHVASFSRHWLAWLSGEQTDAESGLAHLDCAMAQLAIVVDLVEDPPSGGAR